MADMPGRYAKQVLFRGIGVAGQERISAARVAVIGLGALGSVIAEQLCRAGVGALRLVDRDFVELSNLQRQVLYTEADAEARLPKAVAAAERLRAINSEIVIESHVADVTPGNILSLLEGCDLALDATDNLETRFLLNDACIRMGLPWIYGGALGSSGAVLAVQPGQTACLRCLIPQAPAPGTLPNCETDGVLAATTGAVASLQVAQALRLLVGQEAQGSMINLDVWDGELVRADISRREDCPACAGGRLEYLEGERVSWTTVLCGRNSVQIVPPEEVEIQLEDLQRRLSAAGSVTYNGFLLSVQADGHEIVVFPTGRAIIRGTTDEIEARSLYARYVGV
jgi:adenylyltransferase/sulfurtransferase